MKRIVLFCNAGMSTSVMVKKIQDAAKDSGFDCTIKAYALAEASAMKDESIDMVLLGPQIRHKRDNVKKIFPNIPVDYIDMADYGMMNGKNVLNKIRKQIG